MTAFWIAAGLLTALVLALISRPLLRQRQASHASRKALNTAIYRDQMAELERDLASGALSAADHASARDELERRILEDLADDGAEATAEPRRLPRTAIAVGLALPAAAVLLYLVLGTPAALDPAAVQASNSEQIPTQAEVEKMVASLAAKLEKEPDNPKGWVMLGRSYKVMGRLDEAARAFEKAGPVMETEPELMLEMAELSAAQNEGKVEGKGQELLKRVLADQPDNPQALVLAGTDAYFRKNYTDAARHWERVLAQVPPDSEDARNLSAGLEKVRQLMGDSQGVKPVSREPARQPAAAGATSVSGRVSLAPALKDKASPDDTLFIFARHANGPRMPLAILRLKAAELPKEFTLDDSMAMSPEMKLSSAAELRIEARISKSGDAIPKSGDLAGEITPVKPGAKGLKLVIDKLVP
ncbi:c-type cytochrome biogenesis protein CcmI [Zoogloea sp. LCSB751]|uniref:c-type cytochrome biogenesis protein CcmI n=1 Tax=Zoogloea sp. LCSB751 TaxID=1965277 RepID=UPI0009A547B3|nr:c-type cytochrome biogenesis protein CcmI [Zoogloea sp. LCSB751]